MSMLGGLRALPTLENLSIENADRRQRKNPFVDSPKNFHIDNARMQIRATH
jgi:hypothetical protein